jgi:hypothetical protein
MLKLAIIGILVLTGGFVLYPQLTKSPQIHTSGLSVMTQNLDDLKDTALHRANHEFDKTVDIVEDQIGQINPTEVIPIKQIQQKIATPQIQQVYAGQVYEKDEKNNCKISVPKMAKTINGAKELTHTIILPDCIYEKHDPVSVSTSTDPITNIQTISVSPTSQNVIFETLQLKTTRNQDDTVSIYYEDTSKKTLKVSIALRNSDKQLFSGEFFSSKFDTSVNDVSKTPHTIEMTVEHTDYGTVASSVYNPQGNDATIYGVFSQGS